MNKSILAILLCIMNQEVKINKQSRQILFLSILMSFFLSNVQAQSHQLKEGEQFHLDTAEVHSYPIHLKDGEYLELFISQKDLDIEISILTKKKDVLHKIDQPDFFYEIEKFKFLSPKNENYSIQIKANDKTLSGSYRLTHFKIKPATEYSNFIKKQKEDISKINKWSKDNLVEIKSTDPLIGFPEIDQFRERIENCRAIGLGEATHGTQEEYRYKLKLFKHLVLNYDVKIIAVESSYVGSFATNQYVHGEIDDINKALSQFSWPYMNQDIVALLNWMRDYNKKVDASKKVSFYGYDLEGDRGAIVEISKYVDTYCKNLKPLMDALKQPAEQIHWYTGLYRTLEDSKREEVENSWNHILSYLSVNKGMLVSKSSLSEYDFIIECILEVNRNIETSKFWINKNVNDLDRRDYFMAERTLKIINVEKPDSKILVTSHNFHILKNPEERANFGKTPFGAHLAEILGDKFVNIGLFFSEGKVAAMDHADGNKIKAFEVPKAKYSSIESIISDGAPDNFLLSLYELKKEDAIFKLLDSPWETTIAGGGYNPADRYRVLKSLKRSYDILLFYRFSTPSVPAAIMKKTFNVGDF